MSTSLNGFQIKEQIEAVKKLTSRNEQEFSKPATKMTRLDPLTGEPKPVAGHNILDAFQKRLVLNNQLAFLEKQQEEYNVKQIITFEGKTMSLAEAIKLRGMTAKTVATLERTIAAIDHDDEYSKRNVQTTSVFVPVEVYTKTQLDELVVLRDKLEAQVIELKSLIAMANTHTH